MEIGQIQNNWIDALATTIQEAVEPLFENTFIGVHNALYGGVAYSVFAVYALLWLLRQGRNGYISKDEVANAIKWLSYFIIILVVMKSYDTYTYCLTYLGLPANWVSSAFSHLTSNQGTSFGETITKLVNDINLFTGKLFNYVNDEITYEQLSHPFKFLSPIYAFVWMAIYWVFYIIIMMCIAIAIIIVISSQLTAYIILSIACLTIPLLFSKKTMPYFFSWVKLYICYSFYAPAGVLVLYLMRSPIEKILSLSSDTENITVIGNNLVANFFLPIILILLFLGFFKKIPNFISQIMGVSGLDNASGGIGSVIATTAKIAGGFAMGALGAKMAGASMAEALGAGVKEILPTKSFDNARKAHQEKVAQKNNTQATPN